VRAFVNARLMRLVDAIYEEPDPFETAEEFARSHHDDIASLFLDELDAERFLARLRWSVVVYRRGEPSAWLRDRIARLDQAAARLRRTPAR
jgi:hypothetical protein